MGLWYLCKQREEKGAYHTLVQELRLRDNNRNKSNNKRHFLIYFLTLFIFFFPFLPVIAVIHWQFDKFPHLLRYLQILYTRFHPIFAKCSFSSNHKERYKIQVKPAEHLTIHYLEYGDSPQLLSFLYRIGRSSIIYIRHNKQNMSAIFFWWGKARVGEGLEL